MKWLYELLEAGKIAITSIRANKARGVLTTLGIIIGVVGVITTMTAAKGLENSFRESISALGTDVLYVSRTPWVVHGNWFQFRNRKNLSLKHAHELDRALDAVINPTTSTARHLKFQATTLMDVSVVGTTDKQVTVSSMVPEFGRFLSGFEVRNRKYVCVIGSEIRERLFPGVDPLNKKLKIGSYPFRVIGIMEKQGGGGFFGGPNLDMQVYVPITTFSKSFGSRNRDFDIAVKTPQDQNLADFEYAVIGEMRKVRKLSPGEDEDFSINKMETLVEAYNNVMGVVLLIGLIITGISLFVGGIGVMNIMFVSVTERTREIGIRKAIGAKRRTILTQFLFESSAICLLGGILGLILAYGVTFLINQFLLPANLSLPIAFFAIFVSIAVGIVSGFIPAYKAAKLEPISALRYE